MPSKILLLILYFLFCLTKLENKSVNLYYGTLNNTEVRD